MSEPWMMYAAVVFGIVVAVLGVGAYLRMTGSAKGGMPPAESEKRTKDEETYVNVREKSEKRNDKN